MKKLLLALSLIAASHNSYSQGTIHEACSKYSNFAGLVMDQINQGVSIQQYMDALAKENYEKTMHDAVEVIILEAYKDTRFYGGKVPKNVITSFQNKIYMLCFQD